MAKVLNRTPALFAARGYVTTAPSKLKATPKATAKASAAKASTTAVSANENENRETREDIDEIEAMAIPAETIPSSSALSEVPPSFTTSPDLGLDTGSTDWSKSYSGLSQQPFSKEVAEVLLAPIDAMDIEIKPGECLV